MFGRNFLKPNLLSAKCHASYISSTKNVNINFVYAFFFFFFLDWAETWKYGIGAAGHGGVM
jgi:hypothetical protein